MALPVLLQSSASAPQLVFKCSEIAVMEALTCCPNSYSSPDGIPFKLLKLIAQFIFRPLNIVFQHSLFQGIFPKIWKIAIIIPLHKGYGDPSIPASYRPISLCPCSGKLLEKIVHKQLISFLYTKRTLHEVQHGLISRRSIVTNLLQFDSYVADSFTSGHPYDVITFDFC